MTSHGGVFFILEQVQKTKVDLYLTFVAHTRFIVDLRGIKGPRAAVQTNRAKRSIRDHLLFLWLTFPALTDCQFVSCAPSHCGQPCVGAALWLVQLMHENQPSWTPQLCPPLPLPQAFPTQSILRPCSLRDSTHNPQQAPLPRTRRSSMYARKHPT
ncbi:hypothetical protein AMELA_G00079140 [Ameiurus melas]|uniref:Uncharacterized protein n=1 Tax=Ameiurus melas TaxID=219545 RepID=A0A7J6AZ64_AMEME|nr:hypothetical protein AMELA_G00079140 [Ameiurus melas]